MREFELRARSGVSLALESIRVFSREFVPLLIGFAALALPMVLLLFLVGSLSTGSEIVMVLALVYAIVATFANVVLVLRVTSYHVRGIRWSVRQLIRQLHPLDLARTLTAFLIFLLVMWIATLPGSLLQVVISGGVEELQWEYILLSLGVLVPVFWVMVRYVFMIPIAVLEAKWPFAAWWRSRNLTRGHWWRLFASLAIYIGMMCMIVFLGAVLVTLIGMPLGFDSDLSAGFGLLLFSALAVPVGFVYTILLYYDARMRKEFFHVRDLG